MRIEFDPAKAKANLLKHRVSFTDAEGVFTDPLALTIEDPDAKGEQRFITIGLGSASIAGGGLYGAQRQLSADLGPTRHTKGTKAP